MLTERRDAPFGFGSRRSPRGARLGSLRPADGEAAELGPRIVPFGLEHARLAVIVIGRLDIATELVSNRPAVIGDGWTPGPAFDRGVEERDRLLPAVGQPESGHALVEIGFRLVRIVLDRRVEI